VVRRTPSGGSRSFPVGCRRPAPVRAARPRGGSTRSTARRTAPSAPRCERGRAVLAVAGVLAGDRLARLEGARLELEGHGRSSGSRQGGREGDEKEEGATARHGREASRAWRACPAGNLLKFLDFPVDT